MKKKTVFIGDVHGCFFELKKLMEQLGDEDAYRVILLGDLINKGPNSVEVLRYVFEKQFEVVLGNHDFKYLSKHDSVSKYIKMKEDMGKEIHEWYVNLPYFIEEDDFIAVHGGIIDEESRYDENLMMTVREVNGVPWHDHYKGSKLVVYGHWAKQGFYRTHNTLCLDGGCVYGNELIAYVYEDDRFLKVKAKKIYEQVV